MLWFIEEMDDRADLGWPGLSAEFDARPINGAHRMARDLRMESSVGVLASMIRASSSTSTGCRLTMKAATLRR